MLRHFAPPLALTLTLFGPVATAMAQSSPAERCDALAGHPWEPGHNGIGVAWGAVATAPALEACRAALAENPDAPELKFRLARTLLQDQLYDEAMPLMFEAVAAGYAPAAAAYGTAFVKAEGVDPDYPTALHWLQQAANAGHPVAENNLATMLLLGLGAAPDLDRAIELYRDAAETGYAPAMFGLALAYDRRRSSGADVNAALGWFEKAAASGNTTAIAYVARAYDQGLGVAPDPVEAFRWYRTAAEAGNAAAQTRLGVYYATGRGGIAENKPLAREWLGKAAVQSFPEAMLLLGRQLLVEPLRAGDPAEGIAWLERAATFGETEANALLGEFYARSGDPEKARAHAQIVIANGTADQQPAAEAVLHLATFGGEALDPASLDPIDPRAPRPLGQH
jgi:TPR repeat protein